ncbi:MAG: GatB/YqeY domain-containing protein [Bacteroidales bacterium]|nr:GatB/YqeY domain-containing protein [Bacteroidales bacterium]
MSLEESINNDIKAAMLAKEKRRLEALRAVKAAILLAKTEKGGKPDMGHEAEIKILQKLVKQRKESADIYRSQGRNDLEEEETFQASVIMQYLPEQMDESELRGIIGQIIATTGASGIKDMGKVMGLAAAKLAGKAENKTIAALVKQLLSEG